MVKSLFARCGSRTAASGFTLVEFLVVMAMVVILAGMMLPFVTSARERAQSTHCLSNQRQLVAAFQNYSTDWDDVLPRMWTPDGGPKTTTLGLRAGQRDWAVDIFPYTQNEQIYICPIRRLIRGYGINLWLASSDGFPQANIIYPSRMAMFAEIAGKAPKPGPFDFVDRSAPEGWPLDGRFLFDPRHHGGANIAFMDGSAKWVPSGKYTQWPTNARFYTSASQMGMYAGGTPMGTYWWPSRTSPP